LVSLLASWQVWASRGPGCHSAARDLIGWTTPRGCAIDVPSVSFSRFSKSEEADFREIEEWASAFKLKDIPVTSLERNFVRSSGPGGQHVNKTNSKAELRFSLASASWLPSKVRDRLRSQPVFKRYLTGTGAAAEVILTADDHRVQAQNLAACVSKLHAAILEACVVPKETSQEQKEKVERLKRASDERRLADKQRQKERKARPNRNDY